MTDSYDGFVSYAHAADALVAEGHATVALELVKKVESEWTQEWVVQLPLMAHAKASVLHAVSSQDADEALSVVDEGLSAARERGMVYEEGRLLELAAAIGRALGRDVNEEEDAANRILQSLGVVGLS